MPIGLKIFLWSLLAGVGGGWAALRVGFWVADRFWRGEPLAVGGAVLASLAVGVASAVTAGVLIGKKRLPGS
jgi:hypothetical protein